MRDVAFTPTRTRTGGVRTDGRMGARWVGGLVGKEDGDGDGDGDGDSGDVGGEGRGTGESGKGGEGKTKEKEVGYTGAYLQGPSWREVKRELRRERVVNWTESVAVNAESAVDAEAGNGGGSARGSAGGGDEIVQRAMEAEVSEVETKKKF